MAETMAPQVYPPGRVVLYSNHGNALAGLVVEQVAGVPFGEYVQTRILQPLQMDDSRFGLDPSLADRLATGYTLEGKTPRVYEYLYVKTTPASALHTTARDLARYMRMHLQQGQLGDEVLLQPQTVHRMRTPAAASTPRSPGSTMPSRMERWRGIGCDATVARCPASRAAWCCTTSTTSGSSSATTRRA